MQKWTGQLDAGPTSPLGAGLAAAEGLLVCRSQAVPQRAVRGPFWGGCKVETAPGSRPGARKGEILLCCKLRVIFIVTGDDLAISLPAGVSFKPPPQADPAWQAPRAGCSVCTCVCTCAHTRMHARAHTHTVGMHRSAGHSPLLESMEGLSWPESGLPAPDKGITALQHP